MDRHVGAPSISTSMPRSFPEYPWSSPNNESYISLPPHRSPPSAAATLVRMHLCPSPRLPSVSPHAGPCHVDPPSPTDDVATALSTSCLPGSRTWPRLTCGDRARRARDAASRLGRPSHFGQRAKLPPCGLGPITGLGLCGSFTFFIFVYQIRNFRKIG
jgi:hypothetical protein